MSLFEKIDFTSVRGGESQYFIKTYIYEKQTLFTACLACRYRTGGNGTGEDHYGCCHRCGRRFAVTGVSVVIKGTHLGTATDAMGKYSIRIDGKAVLVFTFIGMQTQEIPVNNRSVVNVNMRLASIGIDEVVVTGYGTTTKGSFTGSAAVLGADNISKKPMQIL